jgi:hypothetical protein
MYSLAGINSEALRGSTGPKLMFSHPQDFIKTIALFQRSFPLVCYPLKSMIMLVPTPPPRNTKLPQLPLQKENPRLIPKSGGDTEEVNPLIIQEFGR